MNSVILLGRITKDLQIQYNANQRAYLSFSVAVDRRFKDQNGNRQADFISCKAFGQTAEFIAKYFGKGKKIALRGSIQTGKYEKNGATIYTTDVIVDEVEFVEFLQPTQAQQAATAPQIAPDINTATPGGAAVQAVKDIKEATSDSFDDIMSELPFSF